MTSFFAIQQLSGIFLIFIFAARYSLEAGVTMDEFLSAVILGAIRVVMTFCVSFATDKYGRKPIAIFSSTGMLIAMIGLIICQLMSLNETSLSWLAAVFLFGYCIFGVPGILTLPFAMVAEMYPQKYRSMGIGFTISFCFICAFVTIKTFATFFELFGSVTMFSFYAVISAIGIFFSIYILPETNGKTLFEMENLFKKKTEL